MIAGGLWGRDGRSGAAKGDRDTAAKLRGLDACQRQNNINNRLMALKTMRKVGGGFRAKWTLVRVKKTRQNKNPESTSISMKR